MLNLYGYHITLCAAVLSFLLRLLISNDFTHSPYYLFTLNMSGPDQNFFAKWAESILAGQWHCIQNPAGNPFYAAPLYPWLISISLSYKSNPLFPIHILQCFLSSYMVVVLYKIGRLTSRPVAGVLAAFIWLCYGPGYYYDSCLIRASLSASLTGLLLYSCLKTIASGYKIRYAIVCGIVLGLQSLLRPSLFFFIIPLIFLTGGLIRFDRKILLAGILITVCSWATISPATYNNWIQSGRFVPVSAQGADSLILGNDLTGPGAGFHPTSSSAQWRRSSGNDMKAVLKRIALNTVQKPGETGILYLRKLRMLINDYEIGSNYSYYVFKKFVPAGSLPFLGFGFVFPLAMIGLFVGVNEKRMTIIKIFFLVVLGQALFIHILSRYRYPAVIPMVLLAAFGADFLLRCLLSKRRLPLIAGVLAVTALIHITRPYPSYGVRFATDSKGKRGLMTENISRADCITVILACMMYGNNQHAKTIADFSIYGFKHYGIEFIADFHKVSRKLILTIKDQRRRQMLISHIENVGIKIDKSGFDVISR